MDFVRKRILCNAIVMIYFEKNVISREALLEEGYHVTSEEFKECLSSIQELLKIAKENSKGRH